MPVSSPGPVLSIMLERKRDNVAPGSYDDGHTIIEADDGGGMGCPVGLGIGSVLTDMELMPDKFAVVSGGFFNATARITGQRKETYNAYRYALLEGGFIDYSRVVRRQPIVDLSLLRHYITVEQPLDVESLMAGPELGIGITKLDRDTYEPWVITTRQMRPEDVVTWAMRGVHLPRVAGKPPKDEAGTAWVDGGMSIHSTVDVAEAMGATHTLRISNDHQKTWTLNEEFTTYVGRWIERHGPSNGLELHRRFAAEQVQKLNAEPGNNIQTIYPPKNCELPGVLCRNGKLIEAGFKAGQTAALLALGFEVKGQETHPQAKQKLIELFGTIVTRKYFALAPCIR